MRSPRDPVLDREVVVVHQATADRPAFVFVCRPDMAQLLAGRKLQALADVTVPAAPLEEAAGVVAGCGSAVDPLVQVNLGAVLEVGAMFAQPDEQGDSGADAGPDRCRLGRGDRRLSSRESA
ncbi:hypothetical protein ACIBP6_03265 [Nonomuraea terrae]|uniref:hypothetical protein n=1 Tax=Nonomuraea terrae TaxID=2530383 RepID=UPI0037921D19